MAKIVVALGGNALSRDGKATAADQLAVANETAAELVKLIAAGHTLAIVHGNGPQIGNIILHEEAINTEKTPTMPVDVAGAMSQGQIGYWLQNAFETNLNKLASKNRSPQSLPRYLSLKTTQPSRIQANQLAHSILKKRLKESPKPAVLP